MVEALEYGDEDLFRSLADMDGLLNDLVGQATRVFMGLPTTGQRRPDVVEGEEDGGRLYRTPPASRVENKERPPARDRTSSHRPEEYPVFYRDDDKLVKIGWSQKKQWTYRHSCGTDELVLFAFRLEEMRTKKEPVRLSEVLNDLEVTKGLSLSNYQVYTCVDWLLAEGLLRKQGGKYVLEPMADVEGEVLERWRRLPETKPEG